MPKIIENLPQRLQEEARRQIEQAGFAAMTIRSVAKGCGVGVGTVYNYYPSKEALVASFMLSDWNACVASIQQTAAESDLLEPVLLAIYEKLGRNMNRCVLLFFFTSALLFMLVYLVKAPVFNIAFIVLAIMASNAAASILWSMYCPSLAKTGMVSSATGFLDFVSYMAAAISSKIFANAVDAIGWGNLILVWFGLMVLGVLVALPKPRQYEEN